MLWMYGNHRFERSGETIETLNPEQTWQLYAIGLDDAARDV